MSENKKNGNNGATITPDGAPVEIIEKKGFFQKIKEKKDGFVEKHPVGCRRAKTVVVGALGAIGGFATKAFIDSRSKGNSDIEMVDIDAVSFDDAAVNTALEEVNDDN